MKLGIFCANGVEEVECLTTVDYCRRAGLDICMYSVHDTNEVTGAHDIPFLADRLFDAEKQFLVCSWGQVDPKHRTETLNDRN